MTPLPNFTLAMRAATSRLGPLCDTAIVFVLSAAVVVLLLVVSRFVAVPSWLSIALIAAPFLTSFFLQLSLLQAQSRVERWLSTVPFPVENIQAILSGSGEHFELHFVEPPPIRDEVMRYFAKASDDVFVLETDVANKTVTARFGVIDSKWNPYGTAYCRYERARRVVQLALVPLHLEQKLAMLRVV